MITIDGFVITDKAIRSAFWLLSRALGLNAKTIECAVASDGRYNTIFVRKGNGNKKKRRIDIPCSSLKEIQTLLLRRCFERISLRSLPDWEMLVGYKKGLSNTNNISPHIGNEFFLQIDLSDAFPSVNTTMIRKALAVLFEVRTITSIFSSEQTCYFRREYLAGIKKPAQRKLKEQEEPDEIQATPLEILWGLREVVIWLTMLENKLPQGAPTSPFLFNLVIADQRLPSIVLESARSFLGEQDDSLKVTLYADNITISAKNRLLISDTAVGNIISNVEARTPFRVNRNKVFCNVIKYGSPNITGLAIGERQGKRIATVSRATQRRIRGLLHAATTNPDLKETALGSVAYLLNVYGGRDNLPKQIRDPYDKILAASSA